MAGLRVAPRSWVPVRIPAGSIRATMAIGDERPQPAYIENVRGHRGGVETYAKRRCPDLRPGRYTVRVTHDGGVTETQLNVM